MSLFRNKNDAAPKTDSRKLVFSGKRLQGTWIMETNLAVPVRRSEMNAGVVVADNRRVRTLH
jgi:hypothetical protein